MGRQQYVTNFDFCPAPSASRLRRGRRTVVQAWERALLFRDGVLVTVLDAGAHRRWRRGFTLRRVDIRPWIVSLPTQEVPTADGIGVKVTVAGRARVVDPVAFVNAAQDPHAAMYLAIQIALREAVVASTAEALVSGRGELGQRLLERVRGIGGLGIALEQLELKDIVLPAEVKRAQAEILLARAKGLADLERARGETAALRNLANAARLAADNPALLQLRLLQQLGATTGHTVVIGAPPLPTVARPG